MRANIAHPHKLLGPSRQHLTAPVASHSWTRPGIGAPVIPTSSSAPESEKCRARTAVPSSDGRKVQRLPQGLLFPAPALILPTHINHRCCWERRWRLVPCDGGQGESQKICSFRRNSISHLCLVHMGLNKS